MPLLHRQILRRGKRTREEDDTGLRAVRRIVRDPGGYYAALKPHVDVESAPARVTRKGIVTQDGREIELDAIIYATGYHLDFLSNIDIQGPRRQEPARTSGPVSRNPIAGGMVPASRICSSHRT